jgi:F-type H+-transporting ATPase subunit b
MSIFYNSTLVVAIALVLFIALLAYLGVHKFLGKALDDRAAKIRSELDEARALREEAQATFAEFERKQKEVEGQAQEIVAQAKAEAQAAAERAKSDLADQIARRLKAADDQIALAEANAVKEVKDKAVSVAIASAAEVLQGKLGADKSSNLVDAAIEDIGAKLH